MKLAIGVLCGVVAVSCGSSPTQPSAPAPAAGTPSAAVREYLNNILDLMRTNSINRQTIDWTALQNDVFRQAGGAQTNAELTPAIRVAITGLRDGHSSYRSATGTTVFVPLRSCGLGAAPPINAPPTIGTVRVTAFSGTVVEANLFARQLQDAIAAADRDDLVGWIVDLRGNGGGNMWPMIAGVGPILGEGPLGFFIDPFGAESVWEYRNGSSVSGSVAITTVSPAYTLRRPEPRVAVLSNIGVASSGEATLIAFRQRPNTRSFGEASCGLSTSNRTFILSDGATLNITQAVMADRAKNRYGDRVPPDEAFTNQAEAVQRAIAWLQTGR